MDRYEKGQKQGLEKSPAVLKTTEKSRQVASEGKVGKGKPPEAFKWKPGESGNPSGKPSAHRAVLVASVKEMLAQVDPKLNKNLFERLLEQCARRALQGSKWHMGVLLDYGLGKPTQMLEHSGGIDLSEVIREAQMRDSDEPAEALMPVPTSGISDAQPIRAATATAELDSAPEDDAERSAKPKIRVEPWAN